MHLNILRLFIQIWSIFVLILSFIILLPFNNIRYVVRSVDIQRQTFVYVRMTFFSFQCSVNVALSVYYFVQWMYLNQQHQTQVKPVWLKLRGSHFCISRTARVQEFYNIHERCRKSVGLYLLNIQKRLHIDIKLWHFRPAEILGIQLAQ